MTRCARLLILLVASVALAGCDTKPTLPSTDPDSIKKLEELQKQGRQGEGDGKGSKAKP